MTVDFSDSPIYAYDIYISPNQQTKASELTEGNGRYDERTPYLSCAHFVLHATEVNMNSIDKARLYVLPSNAYIYICTQGY